MKINIENLNITINENEDLECYVGELEEKIVEANSILKELIDVGPVPWESIEMTLFTIAQILYLKRDCQCDL